MSATLRMRLRPRPPRLVPLILAALAHLAVAIALFAGVATLAVVLAARGEPVALLATLAAGVPLYGYAYESTVANTRHALAVLRVRRHNRAVVRAAVAASVGHW